MERPVPGNLMISKFLLGPLEDRLCNVFYVIVQVLFRIFDNMKLKENGDDSDFPDRYLHWSLLIFKNPLFRLAIKSEWLNTTCNHALYALTDVFSQVLHLFINVFDETTCSNCA